MLKIYLIVLLASVCCYYALHTPAKGQSQQEQQLQSFLNSSHVQKQTFSMSRNTNGLQAYTNLDDYRELYGDFRNWLMQMFLRNEKENIRMHRLSGKMQKRIPKSQKFPCPLNGTRSESIPESVHRLRPGDIDIIAAMGDSMTAGTAVLSANLLQDFAEFRSLSMIGGGHGNWRKFLTLPNIFKEFNPKLYGYAIGNTLARERGARFNVAEPNSFTTDMPFQARVLIKRMQNDPQVDMKRHWKLITIFIASNDVCSEMCYYDNVENFYTSHRQYFYRTLKILKDNIPRLLVSILPVPSIPETFLRMRNLPLSCYLIQTYACSCILRTQFRTESHIKFLNESVKRVQDIDREVANLPEFQTDTFAVVYQPFTTNFTTPQKDNGDTDLGIFAVDCFHFSQLGHAVGANMLWNNMLQREGEKDLWVKKPFESFECPSADRPYIATLKNSLR